MKRRKNIWKGALLAGIFLFAFSSCSDDDDFNSRLPEFGAIKITPDTIIAASGDSVTVEIPISSSGKYVSRSNYSWSLSSGDPITDLTDRSDVLDRKSLKCRFPVPETHGRYTITYKANYVVSGQAQSSSWSKALSSGGRVSYTLAQLYGNITITQEIEVERAD